MESLRSKKALYVIWTVLSTRKPTSAWGKRIRRMAAKRRKTISFPYECQQPLTKRITE